MRVRLKPDATDIDVTIIGSVRLQADVTNISSVRLQADRWRWVLVLSLLCAVGCAQPAPEPGIITVAIPVSPNNLDPRYGTDENSARAHQLLYNDLLRWDEQNRLAPGLAASWDTADNQ